MRIYRLHTVQVRLVLSNTVFSSRPYVTHGQLYRPLFSSFPSLSFYAVPIKLREILLVVRGRCLLEKRGQRSLYQSKLTGTARRKKERTLGIGYLGLSILLHSLSSIFPSNLTNVSCLLVNSLPRRCTLTYDAKK